LVEDPRGFATGSAASIKPEASLTPLFPTFELFVMAANRWSPNDVLNIGVIDDAFRCVGLRIDEYKCTNPISKDHRTRAREIIRNMSTLDVTANDFHESLDDLSEVVLCTKSKHRLTQRAKLMNKWEKDIKDFAEEKVQQGDVTVMGEAPSLTSSILAGIDDSALVTELMERIALARKDN